jgi:hypothetical protein
MLRKETVWAAMILGLVLIVGPRRAPAQEANPSSKAATSTESTAEAETKSKTQSAQKPYEAYRLDFSINEMEDGKKINSRQYSMNLTATEPNEVRIGTRVPVEAKEGEFQYLDVGTNIFARLGEARGQTELVVRFETSNFAAQEQNPDKRDSHPIIRQLKIGGSTLLPLSKTIVLGSADDPNSKREFQLEVTVTKVK